MSFPGETARRRRLVGRWGGLGTPGGTEAAQQYGKPDHRIAAAPKLLEQKMPQENVSAQIVQTMQDDDLTLILHRMTEGGERIEIERAALHDVAMRGTGLLSEEAPTVDRDALGVETSPPSTRSRPANDRSEAYFEIYRVIETHVSATRWIGGEWRWRFCATGGETIASSSAYATRETCIEAAAALRRDAGVAAIYQLA